MLKYETSETTPQTYLCLIMCCICFFMVSPKSIMKYSNRIGQNTGMLKMGKNVAMNDNTIIFVADTLRYMVYALAARFCLWLWPRAWRYDYGRTE